MKIRVITGIMFVLLLTSMLPLSLDIQPVKSDWTWTETIYIRANGSVDPDTAPISSVDNITYTLEDNIVGDVPEESSAIVVERDNIVVDGKNYAVQGAGSGTGIDLSSRNNVTIKNTRIKELGYGILLNMSSNIVISGNAMWGWMIPLHVWRGILLESSSNNIIYGNTITSNWWTGIHLQNSSNNNTISKNTITDNFYGIMLSSSSNNSISGNIITKVLASLAGIALEFDSDYNTISGNHITNNMDGIELYGSSNNRIWGNTIKKSEYYGILLIESSNNSIYHNNLVNNTQQVYDYSWEHSYDPSINTWDDGYPSGGNYWSDHNPPDIYSGPCQNETDSDAIGDTPYIIDESNTDRYPAIYPYGHIHSPDVYDDGIIDIMDILVVGSAFGSIPGDLNWNPIADLYTDEVIDIMDILVIAVVFGETYP